VTAAQPVVSLTCDGCDHEWDVHFTTGGCRYPRCLCDQPRPVITPSERMAALRAALPSEPLVSHVDDRRLITVGMHVTEGRDGDNLRSGVVVERWMTTDGEPGVTFVEFHVRSRHKTIDVAAHRLLVSQLRDEVLPTPDSYSCAFVYRMLFRAIGQRTRSTGNADVLSKMERRWVNWAWALMAAAEPTTVRSALVVA